MHGAEVERRRDEHDALAPRDIGKALEIRFAQGETTQLGQPRRVRGRHQQLRADGLKLHCLRARRGGAADELLGEPDIAFVIVADLGDNKHVGSQVDRTDLHAG